MNTRSTNSRVVVIAVVAGVAAAAGFMLGRQGAGTGSPGAAPSGSPALAPGASAAATADRERSSPPAAQAERRILYYRNPMGLDDRSPTPKKDSMGMDYVPVYAEDAPAAAGGITLSPEKIQLIGVRTEVTSRRSLAQGLLLGGTVALAESRQRAVAPRFEGWIERLDVANTGMPVRAGQVLATVYSPQLQAIEQEYLVASASPAMQELAQAALERLRLAGVPAAAIATLQRTRTASRTVALVAPISGVVLDKPAIAGMKFSAGDTLFRLADLSTLWVIAQVPEQDLPRLRQGQAASFETAAHPGERFSGRVNFISPTLDATTRSVQARIELANNRGALKPGMFGRLALGGPANGARGDPSGDDAKLSVSASAVIDSGKRQIVLLSRPGGRFEPREVQLGLRGGEFVEILSGLQEGDLVVTAANFLLDAESNLRGALPELQRSEPRADATH